MTRAHPTAARPRSQGFRRAESAREEISERSRPIREAACVTGGRNTRYVCTRCYYYYYYYVPRDRAAMYDIRPVEAGIYTANGTGALLANRCDLGARTSPSRACTRDVRSVVVPGRRASVKGGRTYIRGIRARGRVREGGRERARRKSLFCSVDVLCARHQARSMPKVLGREPPPVRCLNVSRCNVITRISFFLFFFRFIKCRIVTFDRRSFSYRDDKFVV